ncbi:MAG: DUF2090 domain-containing protein [Patescibacteria group bacterium]|nr:DUF2090 domain-containing protein [Patescibacteria group bacterium]
MNNPKQLYILPFDHRATFSKGLFSYKEPLSKAQRNKVKSAKRMIWQAFVNVWSKSKNKEALGILVDEEFGSEIQRAAATLDVIRLLTVEKSGQNVFDFEYGTKFGQHILKFKPDYAKVLVRYNPADKEANKIQLKNLKKLNDFCAKKKIGFLFELLVPPTKAQLKTYRTEEKYDLQLRPILTRKAIYEIRKSQIEPDIWKLEAMYRKSDWQKLIATVKANNKKDAKIIVLGRAGSKALVSFWLKVASGFNDIIGFAVGRTIFFPPLQKYLKKELTKKQAIDLIAKNFQYFIDLWNKNL